MQADLSEVRSKSAYLVGIIRRLNTSASGPVESAVGVDGDPHSMESTMAMLPPSVQNKLRQIFAAGSVDPTDLEPRVLQELMEFGEAGACTILERYASKNLSSVRNKTAFLIGVIKRYREEVRTPNSPLKIPPRRFCLFHTPRTAPHRTRISPLLARHIREGLGRNSGAGVYLPHPFGTRSLTILPDRSGQKWSQWERGVARRRSGGRGRWGWLSRDERSECARRIVGHPASCTPGDYDAVPKAVTGDGPPECAPGEHDPGMGHTKYGRKGGQRNPASCCMLAQSPSADTELTAHACAGHAHPQAQTSATSISGRMMGSTMTSQPPPYRQPPPSHNVYNGSGNYAAGGGYQYDPAMAPYNPHSYGAVPAAPPRYAPPAASATMGGYPPSTASYGQQQSQGYSGSYY